MLQCAAKFVTFLKQNKKKKSLVYYYRTDQNTAPLHPPSPPDWILARISSILMWCLVYLKTNNKELYVTDL